MDVQVPPAKPLENSTPDTTAKEDRDGRRTQHGPELRVWKREVGEGERLL